MSCIRCPRAMCRRAVFLFGLLVLTAWRRSAGPRAFTSSPTPRFRGAGMAAPCIKDAVPAALRDARSSFPAVARASHSGQRETSAGGQDDLGMRFSHVHVYVDELKPLEDYKRLERKLNHFVAEGFGGGTSSVESIAAARSAWLSLSTELGDPVTGRRDPLQWTQAGQDLVEQMLVGLGWRVTGAYESRRAGTRTLAVSSCDTQGVTFLMTAQYGNTEFAHAEQGEEPRSEFAHFDVSHLERFARHRSGRAGFAVLGFDVAPGAIETIHAKYSALHPDLLVQDSPRQYPHQGQSTRVLEVYAYYRGDDKTSGPDRGTLLRFVERPDAISDRWVLPGLQKVDAEFDRETVPAYCDHWVSNVVSRTGFLETLSDTLGFTPKVDFNAGVVAAGEAQIESTVTGNNPGFLTNDILVALQDQSQIYLPINNALSEVGHVNQYLREIGQGVQHIASRVKDLPRVVQRANNFRKITGSGLSFLSIPRSYYGLLNSDILSKDAGIDISTAQGYVNALKAAEIIDNNDIVDLEVSEDTLRDVLPDDAPPDIAQHVLRARYRNLHSLIGDRIDEDTYLSIVRNNILVDVQGDDILMQIFTSNVLQRVAGEEAPFLEFIQRVCSQRASSASSQAQQIRPGCGGFGIRNFLTLFLSIEVSKAAKERADAAQHGDEDRAAHFDRMVNLFNAQLDESSPILNSISDAMTAEGDALERGDMLELERLECQKKEGQLSLQRVSAKYKTLMQELRQELAVA